MANLEHDDRVVTDTPGKAVRQGAPGPSGLGPLSLGISPCPNDTFIFHALAHAVTPGPGFAAPLLADVEELNARAARGELDVVKISQAAVAEASRHYRLLSCDVGPDNSSIVARIAEPKRPRSNGSKKVRRKTPKSVSAAKTWIARLVAW